MSTETNTANTRGSCGELGKGTPSSRLKAKWHKDKTRMSFKRFVRELAKNGDVDAKTLLANKLGKNDAEPSAAKLERLSTAKFSSKKDAKK
jgi:hypothetical protein